ncbi:hypothetical protein ACLKA6_015969 [Drosophila palustris]
MAASANNKGDCRGTTGDRGHKGTAGSLRQRQVACSIGSHLTLSCNVLGDCRATEAEAAEALPTSSFHLPAASL